MVDLPHQLQFSHRFEFREATGIGVPVLLTLGSRKADVTANIDTGASHCIFERRVATKDLGLTVEHGYRRTFSTANSQFEAFGHDVLINVLGIEFDTMVFFFSDPEIRKNVLGRQGWLNRVRLAIVDYDQT